MPHVLIIDDDVQILNMLRQIFEREGFAVRTATNGKKGIELQNEMPSDLVVTDIIMPDKEGVETIKELKQRFKDIKIIAISGGGRVGAVDYLILAEMLGAQRTFTKPIKRKELLKAANELLG